MKQQVRHDGHHRRLHRVLALEADEAGNGGPSGEKLPARKNPDPVPAAGDSGTGGQTRNLTDELQAIDQGNALT